MQIYGEFQKVIDLTGGRDVRAPGDRIKQQRECRQRLAAILRAEAEQNDLAFAQRYFDECRLATTFTFEESSTSKTGERSNQAIDFSGIPLATG